MPIHESVLDAALRIGGRRRGWTFRPAEIVLALPEVNAASVRTHVMSRCCVNAPPHHAHRLPYFRRLRRGLYQVLPAMRKRRPQAMTGAGSAPHALSGPGHGGPDSPPITVEVRERAGRYVADSTALSLKIQGASIESVLARVLRVARRKLRIPGGSAGRLSAEVRIQVVPRPETPEPVVAAYAKDIDRTLIRENLRLSVEGRLRKLQHWSEAMEEVRGAARRTGRRAGES